MAMRAVQEGFAKPAPRTAFRGRQKEPRDQVEWADLIVDVARHRDRAAFNLLFEHFAPRVKSLMLSNGLPEEAAEEVAQETLLTVWRKAEQFDPLAGSAPAWIYTIARNRRIDFVRRRGREVATVPGADAEFVPDQDLGPDGVAEQSETASRVESAVAALTEEQVRVIKLSFFEGRPHAEIARELQIPLGTVKSRLRLATKRLRILLDEFR